MQMVILELCRCCIGERFVCPIDCTVLTHCYIMEFQSTMAIVVICCGAKRAMRILRVFFFMYWNEVSVCACSCNKYL